MNQLQELLQKLRAQFTKLVTTLEESALFERAMARYDGLEPRQQRQIQMAGSAFGAVLLCLLFLYPLVNAVGHRRKVNAYRDLIADIRGLGGAERQKVLSTRTPEGASRLPIANMDEAEMSIEEYLAKTGVPAEFYKLTKNDPGFELEIEELSVKQVQYFLFQIDAWYPQMGFRSVKTQVHPQAKDMLTLKASIIFGAGGGMASGGDMDFSADDDFDAGSGGGAAHSGGGDDFSAGPGGAPSFNSGGSPGGGSSMPSYNPPPSGNPNAGVPSGGFDDDADFEPPPPPPLPPEFDGGQGTEGGGDLPPPAFFEED